MGDLKNNDEITLEGKEKDIKNSNIVPLFETYEELNKLKKYICRLILVKKNHGETTYGTGTLLELKKGNNPFYCLITCEHVIKEQFRKKENIIEIRYNHTLDCQHYDNLSIALDEDKRFIKSYKYLGIDSFIIQIFPDEDGIKKEFFFENNLIKDLAKDNYKELQKKMFKYFNFLVKEINWVIRRVNI